MFRRRAFILVLFLAGVPSAAEVMPAVPSQYVNDYAGVMNKSAAASLNSELQQFERDTSNQILVAIYPTMQSDSSIEDYTVRIANNWKAGGKKKDNGAILFVFIQQRTMFIQVGYGLEGALPDVLCKQIIEQEIKPHFAQGDYTAGIVAGVHAMIGATRGEYKGNGQTVNDTMSAPEIGLVVLFLAIFVVLLFFSAYRSATMYSGYGRSNAWFWAYMLANIFGNSGGGRGSGGGGFGGGGFGGGGGFSAGGGSFGGGGAGGSW